MQVYITCLMWRNNIPVFGEGILNVFSREILFIHKSIWNVCSKETITPFWTCGCSMDSMIKQTNSCDPDLCNPWQVNLNHNLQSHNWVLQPDGALSGFSRLMNHTQGLHLCPKSPEKGVCGLYRQTTNWIKVKSQLVPYFDEDYLSQFHI